MAAELKSIECCDILCMHGFCLKVLAQMFNVSDIAFDQNLNNSQESYGKQTMEIVQVFGVFS